MSLTKSSPAFDRYMDEVMLGDPRDYDADYADWRYHMDRERIEQMRHDQANEQTNKAKQQDGNNVR